MSEERDELVCLALAEGGSDRREPKKKLFEAEEGSGV